MATYLLEKSRVVFQGPNERNYHAFYMLQAGADGNERSALELERAIDKYSFCNQSGCTTNPGWGEDANEYKEMRSACAHVGMKPALQGEAMSVLAGVMHVGNVEFSQASGEEYAAIQNEAKMHLASKLMGCEEWRLFCCYGR